jgi:hypothetical protein
MTRFVATDLGSEPHVAARVEANGTLLLRPTGFGKDGTGERRSASHLALPTTACHYGGERPLLAQLVRVACDPAFLNRTSQSDTSAERFAE